MNIVVFKNPPKRTITYKTAIPKAFIKAFWNKEKNFQKCYYIGNYRHILYKRLRFRKYKNWKEVNLDQFEIDCKDIKKHFNSHQS